jgi:hypothetical protein
MWTISWHTRPAAADVDWPTDGFFHASSSKLMGPRRRSHCPANYLATSLPISLQAQDVGDNVAEIASLNDDVGHTLMGSSKRRSEGCAVHSGYVGDVLEGRSDEIG